MAFLSGRRLIASASLGLLMAIALQLPAQAGRAPDNGFLFDKLAPKAKFTNELLAATLAKDEKTARFLLVKSGFNSDVLSNLAMSFDQPPAPIDDGTVYLEPGFYAGGKKLGTIFIYTSSNNVVNPPGCARLGGGLAVIGLAGNAGQYNSPC